jgi:hypothetical protein
MLDDLAPAERQARKAFIAPRAPAAIQKIFDTILTKVARRDGYANTAEYVEEQLGGVVYHFAINYMGGHTLHHVDEPTHDGPGAIITNTSLQGLGLLYFALEQDETRDDDDAPPPSGVLHRAGDCIQFSGDCRHQLLHGVVKAPPLVDLPTTKGSLGSDAWMQHVRIVATIRGGEVSAEDQKAWDLRWLPGYKEEREARDEAKREEAKLTTRSKVHNTSKRIHATQQHTDHPTHTDPQAHHEEQQQDADQGRQHHRIRARQEGHKQDADQAAYAASRHHSQIQGEQRHLGGQHHRVRNQHLGARGLHTADQGQRGGGRQRSGTARHGV